MTTAQMRRGAVLLEALVALTILAIAGGSVMTLASESARSLRRARERDAELRAASAFFDAVSLWSRDDLDRHLGDRPEGRWRMRTGRPLPTLYTIVLSDSGQRAEVLRTSLYRPEAARVAP